MIVQWQDPVPAAAAAATAAAAAADGPHAVVAVLFCGVLGPHLREQLHAAAAIIT